MGFRCPVCADPQADAVHLANHLAFTAMARGGDHEAWLDEHVPEWGQLSDEGLAEVVSEHAESTEFPQLFEDTTKQAQQQHNHQQHGHSPHQQGGYDPHSTSQSESFDAETRKILEQARRLTQERRENRAETNESAAQGEQPDDDSS